MRVIQLCIFILLSPLYAQATESAISNCKDALKKDDSALVSRHCNDKNIVPNAHIYYHFGKAHELALGTIKKVDLLAAEQYYQLAANDGHQQAAQALKQLFNNKKEPGNADSQNFRVEVTDQMYEACKRAAKSQDTAEIFNACYALGINSDATVNYHIGRALIYGIGAPAISMKRGKRYLIRSWVQGNNQAKILLESLPKEGENNYEYTARILDLLEEDQGMLAVATHFMNPKNTELDRTTKPERAWLKSRIMNSGYVPYMYALSSLLLDTVEQLEGMRWYVIADTIARMDVLRCDDISAKRAIGVMSKVFLDQGIGSKLKDRPVHHKGFVKEALLLEQKWVTRAEPKWLCAHSKSYDLALGAYQRELAKDPKNKSLKAPKLSFVDNTTWQERRIQMRENIANQVANY